MPPASPGNSIAASSGFSCRPRRSPTSPATAGAAPCSTCSPSGTSRCSSTRDPRLRVCFTALAGLGPLHGERMAARGGDGALARGVVDPLMFVETSSYGCRAVDSVVRVLGVDMLVFGSDRPYAEPHPDLGLGDAARHAICVTNPARLLRGDRAARAPGTHHPEEERRA